MRRVLVVNAGSSSLKWVVLDPATEESREQGTSTWPVNEGGRHERELGEALRDLPAVDAVGHRVVHGGLHFRDAIAVDDAVRTRLAALSELAPLHNPAAVAGIDAARARFPEARQVAAFDTAFHATMPDEVSQYALPREWSERWGLRRFGFHGLSVEYAVSRAAELLGHRSKRMIVCHLGAGCSVSAVADGQSADTSMGFTPLEGLMMARRSGSVDPGLLLYLLGGQRVTLGELDQALNERAGVLGVSGVSADMREVLAAEAGGNQRAGLAVAMFVHRVVATIGGMTATLDGLDTLVFTGGIGEHSPTIRARVVAALGFLGARLDPTTNDSISSDGNAASVDSAVRILVIAAREDLTILRHVKRVLGWS